MGPGAGCLNGFGCLGLGLTSGTSRFGTVPGLGLVMGSSTGAAVSPSILEINDFMIGNYFCGLTMLIYRGKTLGFFSLKSSAKPGMSWCV